MISSPNTYRRPPTAIQSAGCSCATVTLTPPPLVPTLVTSNDKPQPIPAMLLFIAAEAKNPKELVDKTKSSWPPSVDVERVYLTAPPPLTTLLSVYVYKHSSRLPSTRCAPSRDGGQDDLVLSTNS